MVHAFGSRTSGVDGSSEGGRINTINVPGGLLVKSVPLVQALQRKNPKAKLTAAPVQVDGTWCIEIAYTGDELSGVPQLWCGRRVLLKKNEPPPSA